MILKHQDLGQGLVPKDYHPLVNALSNQQLQELLEQLKAIMAMTSDKLGSHDDFLHSVSD